MSDWYKYLKVVINAGGLVHVFLSQTVWVGIKYAIAWFTTLKFVML